MDHQVVARKLSKPAAELLLEHVDGISFVEFPVRPDERNNSRLGLVRAGLLRYTQRGPRPQTTAITEDGRAVLCFVLADYAEALTAAGYAVAPARPTAIAATARALASDFLRPGRHDAAAASLLMDEVGQTVMAEDRADVVSALDVRAER